MEDIASATPPTASAPGTSSKRRGRPPKMLYEVAAKEARERMIQVDLGRMAQAYQGYNWRNPKMQRAFLRTYRVAVAHGGYIPVTESRKAWGRWVQNVVGSSGTMLHKSADDEAEVHVPDQYIVPPINFHRAIRAHVFGDKYAEADIVSAHFALTLDVCARLNISCPVVSKYIESRASILESVMQHLRGKVDRDTVKALFLRVLYGGTWMGFVNYLTKPRLPAYDGDMLPPRVDLTCSEKALPDCVKDLFNEMTRIYAQFRMSAESEFSAIQSQVSVLHAEDYTSDRQDSERRLNAKVFSRYVQTQERVVVDACMDFSSTVGVGVGFYLYDGFLVEKEYLGYCLLDKFAKIAADKGFTTVRFSSKSMDVVPDWLGLPTDIPMEEWERPAEDLVSEVPSLAGDFFPNDPEGAVEFARAVARAVEDTTDENLTRMVVPLARKLFVVELVNKTYTWFHFKDHRWRLDSHNAYLRGFIANDVADAACALAAQLEDALDVSAVVSKLSQVKQQASVMTALEHYLRAPDGWFDKMDQNYDVMCFTNGVYDFRENRLRPGRPEDMCLLCTGYAFAAEDDLAIQQEIEGFYRQVHVDVQVKQVKHFSMAEELTEDVEEIIEGSHVVSDWVLRLKAHSLSGSGGLNWFVMQKGPGGNGKSVELNLDSTTFGGYFYKPDAKLVTQQTGASGSTSSETAQCRGKRMVVMSEPDGALKLARIKDMTGGTTIQARELMESAKEFRAYWMMFLHINETPPMTRVDGGSKRRIIIVKYRRLFVARPDPSNPMEQKWDLGVDKRFKDIRYAQQFMRMLIRIRQSMSEDSVAAIPDQVVCDTSSLIAAADPVKVFMDTYYERTGAIKDRIKKGDVWDHLVARNAMPRGWTRSEFYQYLERDGWRFVKSAGFHCVSGIKERIP